MPHQEGVKWPMELLALDGLPHFVEAKVDYEADVAVRVAAAKVNAFRRKMKRLPKALSELNAVPLDPWTDKPLFYRSTKDHFAIWSVGADGASQEGKVDDRIYETREASEKTITNESGSRPTPSRPQNRPSSPPSLP
jgi:hypothetical protein